jgi:hypothetical protein
MQRPESPPCGLPSLSPVLSRADQHPSIAQFPVVNPDDRLARLLIHSHPPPLIAWVLHDRNFPPPMRSVRPALFGVPGSGTLASGRFRRS